jgi:putative FmdB family regulatory protein
MPIYEYECTSCHHQFDLMQKMNDEPVKDCPACHHDTAIKLVSAAGFQLKGTGWYATDFKNKNNGPAPVTKPNETGTCTTTSTDSSSSSKGDAS